MERALHWSTAVLFLSLLATGFTLYFPTLSAAVGRRVLVKDIHVSPGCCCLSRSCSPTPDRGGRGCGGMCAASRGGRRDDSRWLRSLGRRGRDRLGKFNAGQKLNAIFVAGVHPGDAGDRSIMRWFEPFPLDWRTGATFVHDWLAILLLVVVVGHVLKALAEPVALRAMRRGWVSAGHVERHHPRWWHEITGGRDRVASPPS